MPTGPLTPAHVGLLLIVLLLVLGPKRLPETGRALGGGIREFKDALSGHHTAPTAGADDSQITTPDTHSIRT